MHLNVDEIKTKLNYSLELTNQAIRTVEQQNADEYKHNWPDSFSTVHVSMDCVG